MVRALVRFYGRFAAGLGTGVLVAVPFAHLIRLPGWAYLIGLPFVAAGYAAFRAATEPEPTLESLYAEVARREALLRPAATGSGR